MPEQKLLNTTPATCPPRFSITKFIYTTRLILTSDSNLQVGAENLGIQYRLVRTEYNLNTSVMVPMLPFFSSQAMGIPSPDPGHL